MIFILGFFLGWAPDLIISNKIDSIFFSIIIIDTKKKYVGGELKIIENQY